MRKIEPSAALSRFVRWFEVVESAEGMTRTLIPEPSLVIGFRHAGSSALVEGQAARTLPDFVVTGLRSTARRMQTAPGSGIVLAKLREGHASRFFAESLHQLFGESRALDELIRPREVERASVRIKSAETDAERVAIFEQFLLSIARPWKPDPVVLETLRAIDESAGSVRIGALADSAAISQDALEKRFRRTVGATPKQYASIVRLRRAVESFGQGRSLTRVSLDAGYCDQSHFIRQFRHVTGMSPSGFLKSAESCIALTKDGDHALGL
ncbi:MAG: helix-turn-helix domain-containing protein [Polyangiales bacterium]